LVYFAFSSGPVVCCLKYNGQLRVEVATLSVLVRYIPHISENRGELSITEGKQHEHPTVLQNCEEMVGEDIVCSRIPMILETLLAPASWLPPTSALSSSLHTDTVLLLVMTKAGAHKLHLNHRVVSPA